MLPPAPQLRNRLAPNPCLKVGGVATKPSSGDYGLPTARAMTVVPACMPCASSWCWGIRVEVCHGGCQHDRSHLRRQPLASKLCEFPPSLKFVALAIPPSRVRLVNGIDADLSA